MGFFIMGFVDFIGTAINYVKIDFDLNDTMANLLSLSCFFWFLVLSIPIGIIMNKLGRKNMVLISFIFTFAGLLLPFFIYNFPFIVAAFTLIGIGNTIIQVSLNPLVSNVVAKEKLTGSLTLGQFVKALCSWLGPNVAAWFAATSFGWQFAFPVFGAVTLAVSIWLWLTHISEGRPENKSTSFTSVLALLKDSKILFLFIGILLLVGVDIGLSSTLPKYMVEKCPGDITSIPQADQYKSYFYFIVRALGAFVGGILLMKVSERKFYIVSVLLTLSGLILILFTGSLWGILAAITLIAMGYANMFAMIFSTALKHLPEKANEVSSLLIMGVAGGAIALLLGVVSDAFGTQWAAMSILVILWLYFVGLSKIIK
jgi:fucose permease